jgi:hypothetical protein
MKERRGIAAREVATVKFLIRRQLVERFRNSNHMRHSGARALAREPGIHNRRPRAMDSGLATFGGAPK